MSESERLAREEEARAVLQQRKLFHHGTADPEIETIAAVYKHLAALTPEERTRVLAYIEARFAK